MPYDGSKFFEDKSTLKLSKVPTAFLRTLTGAVVQNVFGLTTQPHAPVARSYVTVPGRDLRVLQIAQSAIRDKRNWVQRRYETLGGRRCAVGALRYATKYLDLKHKPKGAYQALMAVALSRGFQDIEQLNDNSTHAQVVSAFDEAAALLMRQR